MLYFLFDFDAFFNLKKPNIDKLFTNIFHMCTNKLQIVFSELTFTYVGKIDSHNSKWIKRSVKNTTKTGQSLTLDVHMFFFAFLPFSNPND